MTDTRHQIELDVGAALACAESATSYTNKLIARVLPTMSTAKEVTTALHHAYSTHYCVAKVFESVKGFGRLQEFARSRAPPSILGDCLNLMRQAREHADQLCRCYPTFEDSGGTDYTEAKNRAKDALEEIEIAIDTIEHQQQFVNLDIPEIPKAQR